MIMKTKLTEKTVNEPNLPRLKKVAATVYLCQALTFMLAGLPLLVGVALDFYEKDAVKDTWLESHFDWQIKTAWIVLAGFALAGITFELFIGFFVLIATVVWMVYRIAVGWYALNDEKPIKDDRI
jgi:uncharacterized membrane protein